MEQKTLGEERVRAAGLENRVRVHLMDYRDLPPAFEKAFDAFVSVEMVEVCIRLRSHKLLTLIVILGFRQHVGSKVCVVSGMIFQIKCVPGSAL